MSIDKTPPTTTSDLPGWTNRLSVTVTLTPRDHLSGADATYWQLDGGRIQQGTSVTISSGGIHTVTLCSVNRVWHVVEPSTVEFKIDRTPPVVRPQRPGASIGDDESLSFAGVPPATNCSALDARSGVEGECTVSGDGTEVGSCTLTAVTRDRVGQTALLTIRYSVLRWTLLGFFLRAHRQVEAAAA